MNTRMYKKGLIALCLLLTLSAISQTPDLIPYRKGNKWGYANNKKKLVVPAIYDSVLLFADGVGPMMINKKWGLIDGSGKEITAPAWDMLFGFNNGICTVINTGPVKAQYGLMDKTGTILIPAEHDQITYMRPNLYRFRRGTLYGFMDSNGKEITPAKYTTTYFQFYDGMLSVQDAANKYGFIDSTGTEVIPTVYNAVRNFYEGIAAVRWVDAFKKSYWQFVDKKGNRISQRNFWIPGDFSEGVAAVKTEEREAQLINKRGLIVIKAPVVNASFQDMRNGLCIYSMVANEAELADKNQLERQLLEVLVYGAVDRTGKIIIPAEYERLIDYTSQMLGMRKEGKWGCMDYSGKILSAPRYDSILSRNADDLLAVKLNGKWGCINKTGKEIIPLRYDSIGAFQNSGIAVVKLNNLFGYINKEGKEIVTPKFQSAFGMDNEGLGCVWINNKCGFVNNKGVMIIPAKYDGRILGVILKNNNDTKLGYSFSNGISSVILNGRRGYIDAKGTEYWGN